MLQLRGAGVFETEDLAPLGVDSRHHMSDRAIFSRGIHSLEDQQHGVSIRCVKKLLQRAEARHLLAQQLLILCLCLVYGRDTRRPLSEANRVCFVDAKVLNIYFAFQSILDGVLEGAATGAGE